MATVAYFRTDAGNADLCPLITPPTCLACGNLLEMLLALADVLDDACFLGCHILRILLCRVSSRRKYVHPYHLRRRAGPTRLPGLA